MKLSIETIIREDSREINSFTVLLSKDDIVAIASKKGIEAANKTIDTVVQKYTVQLKRKLSEALNK